MKKTTAAALFLALTSMTMSAAQASVITYYFASSGVYNGTPVNNTNVFATATFTDVSKTTGHTTTSYVELVMAVNSPLQSGAYVNDWAFNSKVVQGVTVDYLNGVKAKTYNFGDNVINNFGGTGNSNDFDLGFSFSNGNGELAVGSTSTYKLSGTGLSASSFDTPNQIDIFSAVHVQGYGTSAFYSGVTTKPPVINPPAEVPEPGTVALLGLGLLGFAAMRRKAGKDQAA